MKRTGRELEKNCRRRRKRKVRFELNVEKHRVSYSSGAPKLKTWVYTTVIMFGYAPAIPANFQQQPSLANSELEYAFFSVRDSRRPLLAAQPPPPFPVYIISIYYSSRDRSNVTINLCVSATAPKDKRNSKYGFLRYDQFRKHHQPLLNHPPTFLWSAS